TLSDALETIVFQAQNFRDRELMMLLERLYRQQEEDVSWSDRLARLKQFEAGLAQLRDRRPAQIHRLRSLLARYKRLSRLYGLDRTQTKQHEAFRLWRLVAGGAGLLIAAAGWLFNWIPYRLCALLVRLTRKDESEAATFKIIYSLFLFPIAYVLEGLTLWRGFGWKAGMSFAVLILPLTYFTLRFFEWREETHADIPRLSLWFSGAFGRISGQLQRLRARIIREVEALAAQLLTTETTKTTEN
ncbi:MAG TPA: hypothetical protein VJ521_05590, partial [Acidobacteriota bacterium]|nr:hypothetical protein [Acidobacteriota bacterium]